MRDSVIVDYDDKYVYAESLIEPFKGRVFKIPKENVKPNEWIAVGEEIWCYEHNFWNFKKMFDR